MVAPFRLSRIPQTHIGEGSLKQLIPSAKALGLFHVIITGSLSFQNSVHWKYLEREIKKHNLSFKLYSIKNEPTPGNVDHIVSECAGMKPASVIAIGGGSVIDAGKAVSAMIPLNESVKEYLEGVGHKIHPGVKIPFFAAPTTAGTGSEATKNAVISEIGEKGFKKSLRHDNFVPDMAILDPMLHVSCPPDITASSGMDAITQLIESYVSTNASIFTDSLCEKALETAFQALPMAVQQPDNLGARQDMAYAAFISGITLANSGLGTVHGFASSVGGRFDIPHGVVCGTLLAETTKYTIEKLSADNPSHPSLLKYQNLGKMISGKKSISEGEALHLLLEKLTGWTESFGLPRLSKYGVGIDDIQNIVSSTGQKNNPAILDEQSLAKILKNRL